MWLRFAHGQQWKNGTAVGDAKRLTWDEALKIHDTFNQQGGYAGYNDWRIPNIEELKTLVDEVKGEQGNYIDADAFPNNNKGGGYFVYGFSSYYWSSSPSASNSFHAWNVYFGDRNIDYSFSNPHPKDGSSYVRLVRN
jgi:hypothetical protein